MRVLAKISIPTASGNAAIEKGTLGPTIEKMLADLQPESAYFTLDAGRRAGFIVFDLKDVSSMPAAFEPLFLGLGAEIDMTPCLSPDDLRKGLSQLG